MKTRLDVCLALAFAAVLPAQEPPPVFTVPAPAPAPTTEAPLRTEEQLDQLLGPIALYPDALIALVLPAAAAPVDMVLAARYLKDGGDPHAASARAWDDSVKSLAHYPEIVKWMDENIEWTKQVGEAFLAQPADVMKSIQRLRAAARAAGSLVDTPQQIVGLDGDAITIVPAQPDLIYVPRYSPEIVYVRQPYYSQPFLTFGVGFAAGSWLTHDCDWHSHRIWVVNRQWNWREHRDWRRPAFPGHSGYVASPYRQPWRPSTIVMRPPPSGFPRSREFHRPAPMAAAPVQTYAVQTPTENQVTTPPPARRERDLAGRRPAPVAVQTPPAGPQPAQPPPNAAPTISMRGRTEASAPERRARPNPGVTVNRPGPATTPVPQPAYAATPPPARSISIHTPPSTPVVAPLTGPVVSAMPAPPSPHPRIAFPATSAAVPPPAARPAPQAAPQAAPRRGVPPHQTPPPPPSSPRDEKEKENKKVER